jgi:hypothetical protein
VFVLTPSVELMEYSCMEGNLTSLLERSITPWTGPQDADTNLVYGTERDWGSYDGTKPQKLTGVVKDARYDTEAYGAITLEVDRKTWVVVLAPPVRMDFRGLTEPMLAPGVTVSIEGFLSMRIRDELRAETITVGGQSFDLR